METNIKSFQDYIDNVSIDRHFDCCKKIFIELNLEINGNMSKFIVTANFDKFYDINNDYEIYEYGYAQFQEFIESKTIDIMEEIKNSINVERLKMMN